MRLTLVAILITAAVTPEAWAETTSRPGSADPRVLLATYRNNEIYTVVGTYGFQTTVEFSSDESVETVSIGDSVAWQVVPAGHRVFLKPQEPNAVTNMTVVTSLRAYYVDLSARKNHDPAGCGTEADACSCELLPLERFCTLGTSTRTVPKLPG
jgi:type IV secretion system protein VirB9